MVKAKNNPLRGQTVIEIVIAIGILAIVFASAALALFSNTSILTDKKLSSEAESYASEGIEAVKTIAKRDWTAIMNGNYGLVLDGNEWLFSTSTDMRGIFTRVINVSSTQNDEIKTIQSLVSWNQGLSPRKLQISLTLKLTDWESVVDSGGDTGGTGTIPDWSNPRTLGSVDLGAGVSGEDLDVISKIVYITGTASDKKKNDFFIVDASSGQSPTFLSLTDTGPGLKSLDVAASYAYAARDDANTQLQIIDITNASAPTTTANFALPGIGGAGAKANAVYYRNDRVYVGTKAANGPEFHIVDVTMRQSPASLGSKEVGYDVNGIHVRGGRAYLATSDDNEEVKIYNINDPTNIVKVGAWNATGTLDGASILAVGNKLYLGRLGDSNSINHEFIILDISNLNNITILGSKNLDTDVNDFRVRDDLAFLGTSSANEEFQIYDISDPINITFRSSFNFPQIARGVDYEDNLVYVAVRSNDALRIITSQQ
ncbi:MAG: hypothetical protein HYT12_01385 [Candidatus Liptonbacteria bacterium]|nr:hypothetical protein [Candidatus Liptonbacteria bacterium]